MAKFHWSTFLLASSNTLWVNHPRLKAGPPSVSLESSCLDLHSTVLNSLSHLFNLPQSVFLEPISGTFWVYKQWQKSGSRTQWLRWLKIKNKIMVKEIVYDYIVYIQIFVIWNLQKDLIGMKVMWKIYFFIRLFPRKTKSFKVLSIKNFKSNFHKI